MAIVILALICWFGRFAYLRMTLQPTPRPEYWEAKLAELDPPPPGAISAATAKKILTSRPWEHTQVKMKTSESGTSDMATAMRGPWDESRADIAAVMAVFESETFKTNLTALRDAVQVGWQDEFSLSSSKWSPMYQHYGPWGYLLVCHSRWAREHKKDLTIAIEDWLTVVKLGRQSRRQPSLIAFLAEMMNNDSLAKEMMLAAREEVNSIDTARLFQEIDNAIGPALSPQDIMTGERIGLLNSIDCRYVREGGNWLSISSIATMYAGHKARAYGRSGGLSAQLSKLWNLTSPLFHDIDTARHNVNRYYDAYKTDLPVAGKLVQDSFWLIPNVAPLGVLEGYLDFKWWDPVRHQHSCLYEYYISRSNLEAAVTMLALEAYRRDRGTYPQQLKNLVPEYLPRLPIDYLDSQPLRYRSLQNDYLLYSVGTNGKDDGGQDPLQEAGYKHRPDIVFGKVERGELKQ